MNIILVSLDTVRADHLSCYGWSRLTSPHLDRVAAQGARFEQCISAHIPTYPGHTSMMTGRDVYATHVTGQSAIPELPPDIPLLAELLRREGYHTAAADNLGRWFVRGFDHVETATWATDDPAGLRRGEAVADASVRILSQAAGQARPFFLFLHFWDAHTPYLPPPPFSRLFYQADERDPANRSMDPVWAFPNFRWYFHEWMPGVTDIEFPKAQYDAEIAYLDTCLARVLTRLEELGLANDTLLVLTADHGEELDEHGCWFDHHGLYEPNVHIPLVMRLPGRIPEGGTVPNLVRSLDVTPTILDLAGCLRPEHRFEGQSLRPLLETGSGPFQAIEEVFLTENTWMKKRALRTPTWKLIVALEEDIHGLPPVELYHLADDPGERRNLADARPEVVADLRARLDAHVARRVAETGRPDPLPLQTVPLRIIGKPPAAPADVRGPAGDFVGYERKDGKAQEP